MPHPRRTLHLLLVAFFALSAAAHADVIKVPGDYDNLQVAVNNATHGDVILIASGYHSAGPVEIADKALTLVVDQGSQATVPQVRIRDLAPDHHVVLRGLGADGQAFPLGPNAEALLIENCQGRVTVEGSTFRGADGWQGFVHPGGYAGASVENSTSVAFSHCLLIGGRGENTLGDFAPPGPGASGVEASDSDVSVAFCELSGGDGGHANGDHDYIYGSSGGSGIWQVGGTLYVTGALLAGGDGGNGSCDWDFLSGFVCGGGGAGGDGLTLVNATAYHHGLAFAPGQGGFSAEEGEPPAPDGVLVDGPDATLLPAAPRDFTVPAVKREGQTAAFVFSGEPGDSALVWIAMAPRWVLLPAHEGVFLVDNGAPFNLLIPLAPTGLGGDLSVSFTMPALPPAFVALPIHAQGIFQTGSGQFLLGPSSVLTVVDASF